jgi:diguanylate cyclase (GGDEF)-like protein
MRSAEGYGGSQPCGWKSRDGRLWFAGIRGLVMADPRWKAPVTPLPPVLVETVRDARGSHPGNAPVGLGPGARSVEIQYAGLGLRAPGRLRYRYQLEGYDSDWVDAGPRRTAYYPRLPGGGYVFRVASIDADGRQAPEARLTLVVEPAWHERSLVRGLLAGLAVLAGFGLHQLRTWRLRVRQVELRKQVAEQTVALRQANQELERLAAVDGLTGIPNRRILDEALAREWQDHRRRGASLALILCDIDHFKAYNDTQGHPAGDATLRRVAQVLASQCRRATDLAARYGGEEFALLLPDTTTPAALALAEQLLAAVRALALPHPASSAADHVTLSLGVAALVPSPDTTTADLLRQADECLYRAKHAGRNRAVAAA